MKIRILSELRDPELELITEAVENIIPPSMSAIIDIIKDTVEHKAAQDVFAKYVSEYYPVFDGTGKSFNVEFVGKMFYNALGRLEWRLSQTNYYKDWMANQKKQGKDPMGHVGERDRLKGLTDEFIQQFEYGWVYKIEDGEPDYDTRYQSAAWTWMDKFDKHIQAPEMKPDSLGFGSYGDVSRAEYPTDPQRALLVMGQAFKAYTKMLKKWFRKNPEFKKVEEEAFAEIQERWLRAQRTWYAARYNRTKSAKIIEFLNADKNNHNKVRAILDSHERWEQWSDDEQLEKTDGMTALVNFITDWNMSQEMKLCDELNTGLDKPCVLNKFSDGKFWFNRASSTCTIAGDKLANCGSANFDDSTLLMLKSGDLEQGIKWHVMLEWNERRNSIIQVLGFGNSFPEKEHWEEIKWLYENFEKPEIDPRAWEYLQGQNKLKKERVEEFYEYIGHEISVLKSEPKNMADLYRRIQNGRYNHEERGQDGQSELTRFSWPGNPINSHKAVLRFEYYLKFPFSLPFDRKLAGSGGRRSLVSDAKEILQYMAEFKVAKELLEDVLDATRQVAIQPGSQGSLVGPHGIEFADDGSDLVTLRGVTSNILSHGPTVVGGKMTKVASLRFMFVAHPHIWQTYEPAPRGTMAHSTVLHEWLVHMRRTFRPLTLEAYSDDAVHKTEAALEDKMRDQEKKEFPKLPKPEPSELETVQRWNLGEYEGTARETEMLRLRSPARRRFMLFMDIALRKENPQAERLENRHVAEMLMLYTWFKDSGAMPKEYVENFEAMTSDWLGGVDDDVPLVFGQPEADDSDFVAGHFGDDGEFVSQEQAVERMQELITQGVGGGLPHDRREELETLLRTPFTNDNGEEVNGYNLLAHNWQEALSYFRDVGDLSEIMVEARNIVKKILAEKNSGGVKMRIVENNPIQRTASHSFKDKTHPRTDWDDFKYVQARDPDEPEEFEHERSGVRETDHIMIPPEIQQLWDPNDTYNFYSEFGHWYNRYRAKKGKAPARVTQMWSPDGPVEYQGEDRAIVWARVESKDLQHNKPMPAGSKDPSGYGKGWDFKELEERISRNVKIRINEVKTTYKGGGGHLAYKGGKLPTGDNPKGPYPSGGEVADKIGNYKIKVRTNRPMKEPEKPVGITKEPDMEFVEEKEEVVKAAGIIPYRGEGEDIEFLIGQSPQGWWDIFKGKIDEGETALDAAKREFEEESSFSYDGPLEEEMALTNSKVKAWLVEMPDLDAGDFDISKITIISTSEKDKELNKKNPFEGQPEVVAIGWFKKEEAESKMNRRQRPFIGMAVDKLNKKPIDEAALGMGSKGLAELGDVEFEIFVSSDDAHIGIIDPSGKNKGHFWIDSTEGCPDQALSTHASLDNPDQSKIGPLVYDLLIEVGTLMGKKVGPSRGPSESAMSVWRYYNEKRSDLSKSPLDWKACGLDGPKDHVNKDKMPNWSEADREALNQIYSKPPVWLEKLAKMGKLKGNILDMLSSTPEETETLEESSEITKLRIFDFDETIAFTSATTYVETPHREQLEFPDQDSFDQWVKKTAAHHGIESFDPVPELEKLGYSIDFSEYAQVNNPRLNKKVVDHLKRIINKNSDGTRGVYVMTARAEDSRKAIIDYLKEQGFKSSDFAGIITLAGGSKKDAIDKLIKQHPSVNSIAFFDDSDRNISDVQGLRDMYPEMDIQINHVVHGSPKPVEEELLQEGLGAIGWHISNENNRQSIIDNGIRSSMGSTDDINPDYGEGRVYFFSHGQMDRGLHSAKMAMFEGAVVAAEGPYIVVPFSVRKAEGEIHSDPELSSSDIYGPDGYYLVGSVPPEAVIGSHIKHEDELKKETKKQIKENKMKIRIVENKQRLDEGVFDAVIGFFTKKPEIEGFVVDPTQRTYPEGSYGHFAQTNFILAAMHKQGIEINKQTLSQVLQGIASAGATVAADPSASKLKKGAVGVIGLGAIFGGLYAAGAVATALTIAGISAYAFTLINLFEKDPSKADKHPFLEKWKMDEEWREILDDELEAKVEEQYRKYFMTKVKSSPDDPILPINMFLNLYLRRNHQNRNVTKPQEN